MITEHIKLAVFKREFAKNEHLSVCCYCAAVSFPTILLRFTASSIESSSWKFWAVDIAPEKCWCSIYNQWHVQLNQLANSSLASTEWEWRRWIIWDAKIVNLSLHHRLTKGTYAADWLARRWAQRCLEGSSWSSAPPRLRTWHREPPGGRADQF